MESRISTASSSDGLTRLLWTGLVLVLAAAIAAGAWTARSGRPFRSGRAFRSGAGQEGSGGTPAIAPGEGGVRAGASLSGSLPPGDPLPAFTLTDRSGRSVSLSDLRGKVWVANFIFTRCPNVCPELTSKMHEVRRKLQEAGAGDVASVSFSVDPVHDTPEVLAEYARNFHADPSSWLFLTGSPKDVLHAVKDGFQLAMADPTEGPPVHSNRFVVVDARCRMRSTHLGTEDGVVDLIVQDALALRREVRR